MIGRHDFVVRSIDSETGNERWNVTYAALQRLRAPTNDPIDADIPDLPAFNQAMLSEGENA